MSKLKLVVFFLRCTGNSYAYSQDTTHRWLPSGYLFLVAAKVNALQAKIEKRVYKVLADLQRTVGGIARRLARLDSAKSAQMRALSHGKYTQLKQTLSSSTSQNGTSGCPDNILNYYLDNKVVYQKFVIYFSLQSKMKSSSSGTCTEGHNSTYKAHLKIDGTAKFRKRCNSERLLTKTETIDYVKLSWRPYESSRSLSQYDFTVNFSVKHFHSAGDYITPRTYRIKDGY